MDLNRREAVIKLAALVGGTILGPRLMAGDFVSGVQPAAVAFSADDLALLDEIGDTIIPATDVPGAKATGIGAFIAMMVRDCCTPAEQADFSEQLALLARTFQARWSKPFVVATPAERHAFLTELDKAAPQYFRLMKELTVLGYFTSEIGCTQALHFAEVPGSFDGSAPYKRGDHAWFNLEREHA